VAVVGSGGDVTTVGQGISGGNSGCIAMYRHDIDHDEDKERGQYDLSQR
jgi:hypothetical protein